MLCFVLLLFSILRVICGNSPLLQCLGTCLFSDFCRQKEERKHLHDFCTGNNSVSDKRSKQELDRYSEACKLYDVITIVHLDTCCIPISMFKHPVSCLHVIGLLWPAVCKCANLLVALVSTKINSHRVMLQKKNTVYSSGSVCINSDTGHMVPALVATISQWEKQKFAVQLLVLVNYTSANAVMWLV